MAVFQLLTLAQACLNPDGQLHEQLRPEGPPTSEEAGPEELPSLFDVVVSQESAHPALPGSALPADPSDGSVLYADNAIHDIRLYVSTEGLTFLRDEPMLEVPAELEIGATRIEVALRLKGVSSFRSIDEKPSFKIDVHQYNSVQRIDGEKRLTLNNMVQDPTMLREHSYYWLAGRLGVPAPRHAYARVWVNDAAYGLYGLIETMDEELVEQAFSGDEAGNLYESSGADFSHARDWFQLEESGLVVPSPDDIEVLVAAAESARGPGFWEMLNENFDIEDTLSYWALDTVTGNDDGYVYNRHNYLVYNAPIARRWSFLPWGTDRSFSREVPPLGDAATPLLGELVIRCWADSACASALSTRIEEVLVLWETALESKIMDTWSRIEADCEADPRKERNCSLNNIREFVQARPGFMRGAL